MTDPTSGNYLGLFQGTAPVFAPPKTPFPLVERPPGAGETVNCVIGGILHRTRLGASIAADNPELGVMLGRPSVMTHGAPATRRARTSADHQPPPSNRQRKTSPTRSMRSEELNVKGLLK